MQTIKQILLHLTVQPSNPSLSTLDPTNHYFNLTSSYASASHTLNFKALKWIHTLDMNTVSKNNKSMFCVKVSSFQTIGNYAAKRNVYLQLQAILAHRMRLQDEPPHHPPLPKINSV